MSVEERLMKPGTFTVPFVEDTPYSVRSIFAEGSGVFTLDPFGFLGHLFVTPTRLAPEMQTLAQLLASSRFTGVMRRRQRRAISGSGLLVYYGDENGVGELFTTHFRKDQGFQTWMNDIAFNAPAGNVAPYDAGTITNIGSSTFDFDPFALNRREALDQVCTTFAGEYRVNPNNTFDAGPASSLFVTTPTRVVLPKGGPIDISLEGLQALALDLEVDYEQLFIDLLLYTGSDATFVDSVVSANPLRPKDLKGNGISPGARLDVGNVPYSAHGIPLHSVGLGQTRPRRAIGVDLTGYDVGGDVRPGDTIAVYDPLNLLFDTTNQVQYGGRTIYPINLRVYAMTWPLQQGMGVYYRTADGTVTDLSDYVAWETGGTTVEVGAATRSVDSNVAGSSNVSVVGRTFADTCARVTHSANQSVPNATDTALAFDTEVYDPDSIHAPGANTKFTIAVPLVYKVSAAASFASNATGWRALSIRLNGGNNIASVLVPAVNGQSTRVQVFSDEIPLVAGDELEVVAHQNSGGAVNVETQADWSPLFSISRVAATR